MDVDPTCEAAENGRLFTHYADDLGTITLLDTSAGGGEHPTATIDQITSITVVVTVTATFYATIASASVPPPAAHIPTSPQSGFGGSSPTSALHPSNQLSGSDSMFHALAVQAPARIGRLAAIRADDNNNSKGRLSGHIPCQLGWCQCKFPGRRIGSGSSGGGGGVSNSGSGEGGAGGK
ncbi:hypothetical protein BGW80DRAFT_1442389 [Lactifluus volemus]|nr:hypothetical protein BGW80DRAFT_1442389 [Lactifluus volemus]